MSMTAMERAAASRAVLLLRRLLTVRATREAAGR